MAKWTYRDPTTGVIRETSDGAIAFSLLLFIAICFGIVWGMIELMEFFWPTETCRDGFVRVMRYCVQGYKS